MSGSLAALFATYLPGLLGDKVAPYGLNQIVAPTPPAVPADPRAVTSQAPAVPAVPAAPAEDLGDFAAVPMAGASPVPAPVSQDLGDFAAVPMAGASPASPVPAAEDLGDFAAVPMAGAPVAAGVDPASPLAGQELTQTPVGLGERFMTNLLEAHRGTSLGAGAEYLAGRLAPDTLPAGMTGDTPREQVRQADIEQQARDANLPSWQDEHGIVGKALHGGAALAGQLLGGMATPEGAIAGPESYAAVRGGAPVVREVAKAAAVQAAVQGAANSAAQGLNIAGGTQEHFSPAEAGQSAALGALIGGAHPAVGGLVNRVAGPKMIQIRGADGVVRTVLDPGESMLDREAGPRTDPYAPQAAPAAPPETPTPAAPVQGTPAPPPAATPSTDAPAAPAPPPAAAPAVPAPPVSDTAQISTATGRKLDVKYEVVPAADLVHATGDLQPRDRGDRAAYDIQVRQIAATLDPARLMRAPEADRGAPIVGPDNIIESGNGRVQAIKIAMRDHPELYANYVKALGDAGYDTAGITNPVLVARRLTPMDDAERVRFTQEDSVSATAALSGSEQARVDGSKLTSGVLAHYQPGQDPTAAANQNFVRAWIATVPESERNRLWTEQNGLSADGLRRLNGAMLARAYGDNRGVLARGLESTDDAIKSVSGALSDAAPAWAQLRAAVESGRVPREFDLSAQLTAAVDAVRQGRENKWSMNDVLTQQDAFNPLDEVGKHFVRALYNQEGTRAASRPAMADVLRRYATEASRTSTGGDLLGAGAKVSPKDALAAIMARRDATLDGGAPGTQSTLLGNGTKLDPPKAEPPTAPAAPPSRAAAILADLDARKAPDIEYKQAFSTGTKNPLKPGETWRGRLVHLVETQRAQDAENAAAAAAGRQPNVVGAAAPKVEPPPPVEPPPAASRFMHVGPGERDEISTVPAHAPGDGHTVARDWVLGRGADNMEHVAFVDNQTGRIVHASTSGRPSSASFVPSALPDVPGESVTLHHNHPRGAALSGTDVAALGSHPGISHVVAHSRENTSVASLTAATRAGGGAAAAVTRAVDDIGGVARRAIAAGDITAARAELHVSDMANRLLAARGVIYYTSSHEVPSALLPGFHELLKGAGVAADSLDRHTVRNSPADAIAQLRAGARSGPGVDAAPGRPGRSRKGKGLPDEPGGVDHQPVHLDDGEDGAPFEDHAAAAGQGPTRTPLGGTRPGRDFNAETSPYRQVFRDAGHDPDLMVSRPIAEQVRVVADHVKATFGFKDVLVDPKQAPKEVRDQLSNFYQNALEMANALGMPHSAIGLDGRLTFTTKPYRNLNQALGLYAPVKREITIPGRSNSFAHEWTHALDHFLSDALANNPRARRLLSELKGTGDEKIAGKVVMPGSPGEAFVRVLQTIYGKHAATAAEALRLEFTLRATRDPAARIKIMQRMEEIGTEFANAQKNRPNNEYWGTPAEMLARAHEAYVSEMIQRQGGDTRAVVKPYYDGQGPKDTFARLYPQQAERDAIFQRFTDLHDALRRQSILDPNGTGTGARPNGLDIVDPRVWDRMANPKLDPGLWARLKRGILGAKNQRESAWDRLGYNERAANPGRLGVATRAADAARGLTYSIRGIGDAITARQPPRARAAYQKIMDLVSPAEHVRSAAGAAGRYFGPVFEEDVRAHARPNTNRMANILDHNDLAQMNDQQKMMLRHVLTEGDAAYTEGGRTIPVPANIARAGSHLRYLLDQEWERNRKSGVDVGYARSGYFPRMYDDHKIYGDQDKFEKAARDLHTLMFNQEVGQGRPIL